MISLSIHKANLSQHIQQKTLGSPVGQQILKPLAKEHSI